jgi:hypothetical protein
MSAGTGVLDKALAKMFNQNDAIVKDPEAFDLKVNDLFSKRAVKDGIRNYLASHGTSPRVMALLIYSTKGRETIKDMLENQDMPAMRLYDPLVFDGMPWIEVNAPLPIYEDIAAGDERWAFQPHEWFNKIERLSAFPGVISAMVDRYRRQGRLDQVFRHIRLSTLADLLEHEPAIFETEVKALPSRLTDLISESNRHHDLGVCLVRTYLDQIEAMGKVLGSKPIQRD